MEEARRVAQDGVIPMQPPPHVPRNPHRTPQVAPRVTQRGQIRFAFHDGSSPTIERAVADKNNSTKFLFHLFISTKTKERNQEGRSEKKLDTRGGTVGGFPKKSPPPPPVAVRLRSRPVAAASLLRYLILSFSPPPIGPLLFQTPVESNSIQPFRFLSVIRTIPRAF